MGHVNRDRSMALIKARLKQDALVICGLGTTTRAWRAQNAHQLTYYVSDPMGIALSLALGVALAQPNRDVIYLGGDGDFIMSLSCLLTIAGAAPQNFKIIIFNNGRYDTGGSQPLVAADKFSLSTIARGAGLTWAAEAEDDEHVDDRIAELFRLPGPGFLAIQTGSDPSQAVYPVAGPWSQVEDRAVFMRRLQGQL